MLICYGCGTIAHHGCYGIKTKYNEVLNDDGDKIRMFVCDKCNDVGPDRIRECSECNQSTGAFKKASDGNFVHVTCALFSERYAIDNFEYMTIKHCPESDNHPPTHHRQCDYCGNSENLFKCDTKDCSESVHIYCGFLNKMEFLLKNEESLEGWAIRLYREGHTPKLTFDIKDQNILQQSRHLYETSLQTAVARHNSDSQSITSREEALLNQKYEEFIEMTSQVIKSIPSSNSVRGGAINFECQKHRTSDIFCLCHLPYDYMRLMFGCDGCDDWFHCTCVGLNEDQVTQLKQFFCKKCQDWSSLKQSILLKSDRHKEGEPSCKTIDKVGVIPEETSRFSIIDFLTVCILIEKKLSSKPSNNDLKSYLEDILDTAKYIPFNINAFILNLLKKRYLASILDVLVEKHIPFEDIKEIKGIFNLKTCQPDQAELAKQRDLYNHLNTLYSIYQGSGLPKTVLSSQLELTVSTLQWILSFNDAFCNNTTPPSLEILERLNNEAQIISVDKNLPEMTYLRDLLSNAAS